MGSGIGLSFTLRRRLSKSQEVPLVSLVIARVAGGVYVGRNYFAADTNGRARGRKPTGRTLEELCYRR